MAVAMCCGCQSPSPWGNSMSPTQQQTRQMDKNGQPVSFYDLDDGDNEDPNVDQNGDMGSGEPWWNSPGYIGG